MGGGETAAAPAAQPVPAETPAAEESAPAAVEAAPASFESQDHGEVAPPPQTDPLGITGDQIEELSATIAPVGAELQDDYDEPDEPEIDITGIDIAPVGADLSDGKKATEPPPPDTSGITLAD